MDAESFSCHQTTHEFITNDPPELRAVLRTVSYMQSICPSRPLSRRYTLTPGHLPDDVSANYKQRLR